jgi:signal transduction histidine kinase
MEKPLFTLETFLENIPLGIIILDNDFTINAGNSLAFNLLHIPVEELLTNTFDQVVSNGKITEALEEIRDHDIGKQDFIIEDDNQYIKYSIDKMINPDGISNSFVIIVENAAKYKKLETMKQEFIHTILHKIRAPLSTLKTSLSLINASMISEFPEPVKEVFAMSMHEVTRLTTLLNDLRDLFFIETGVIDKEIEIESFPVGDALDRAIAGYRKLAQNTMTAQNQLTITGDRSATVKADFDKLKQILEIILKNAFNFSPDQTPVEIKITNNTSHTTIEVKDHGIGIPDDTKDFIFTKFYREDNDVTRTIEGNGLGLFVAHSLVECMKGTLYCESQKGHGSSFFITLPCK